MPKLSPNNIRFNISFFILFTLIALGIILLFKDFWNVIFLSIVYSILVNTIYKFLTRKSARLPVWAATLLTMLISLFILVAPLLLILRIVVEQASQIATELQIEDLDELVTTIRISIISVIDEDGSLITREMIQNAYAALTDYSSQVVTTALGITRLGIRFLVNFFIFIIISFSLIPNLDALSKYVLEISPLGVDVTNLYLDKSKAITVNMLKGNILVAAVQALVAGLLLWLVGIPYITLWIFIMFIFALIPFFSTAFVTIPIGIYLIATGDTASGLIVIIGQLLIVGTSDNILKSYLAAKETKIANALLILSLMGGIRVWGIFGIFYGPLLLVLFLTSLEIYKEKYSVIEVSSKGAKKKDAK